MKTFGPVLMPVLLPLLTFGVSHPGRSLNGSAGAGNAETREMVLAAPAPVAEKKPLVKCVGHEDVVTAVALSPDGEWAVSGSEDRTLRLWNTRNGKQIWKVQAVDPPRSGPLAGGVWFSPDGKVVGSLAAGVPRFWDAASGQEIKGRFDVRGKGHGLAFSPDGKQLVVSGEEDVQVWDLQRGRRLHSFPGGEYFKGAWQAKFSKDGTRLAAALHDDGTEGASGYPKVRLWDLEAGKELVADWKTGQADAVALSPDGKLLAAGGTLPEGTDHDGVIQVWSLGEPAENKAHLEKTLLYKVRADPDGLWCLAFSPDGKVLASGGVKPVVKLWDAATGELLGKLEGHSGQVRDLAFSADGKTLASTGRDRSVLVWQIGGATTNLRK